MRTTILVGAAFVAVTAWGCANSSNPATPSVTAGGGGGGRSSLVAIDIVGAGDQAFDPAAASAPPGSAVVFANTDDQAHRIVATDGAFDTGVLTPGQSSAPIVPSANGAYYYCAVHPQELGSIASSSGTQAPCTGPHCG